MINIKFLVSVIAEFIWLTCGEALASGNFIKLEIGRSARAILNVEGAKVFYRVSDARGKHYGRIDIDTDNELHIDIDDYSFNGRNGFSVWYFDDGMRTYTIHRVFEFSEAKGKFEENFPKCGENFINLRIDKRNHKLISTYWNQNTPKTCETRLKKM